MNENKGIQTSSVLERGREVVLIAERALRRERDQQMHLWRRYRDVVKLYVAQLGLMAVCFQDFSALDTEWFETEGAWWITVALSVSVGTALWCFFKLYQVFDGDDYEWPEPSEIQQSLLYLDHYYQKDLEPDGFVYSEFYELSDQKMFEGGHVPTAAIGEPLQNLSLSLLKAAKSNAETNKQRSELLMKARWILIIGLFSAIVAWVFKTAVGT